MTEARCTVAALALIVSATSATPGQVVDVAAAGRVLRVISAADDGRAGTLRWAIDASNATPERDTIELALEGPGPYVITLASALPPLRGPARIVGAAWERTGDYVAIDGAGYIAPGGPERCPGASAGQYGANVRTMSFPGLQLIDTSDVEIAGVEIRRFCIGVLVNRSSNVVIRDSRIVGNRGGAGIMLTGDDGQGNPTSTTTVHNKVLRTELVDNGDGLELTRGAAFNLVADNVFRSTAANPETSQGIEILRGNDNVISGNRFEGYSDGVQINWGDRNYIVANTFTGNTFGLNLTGLGNIVDSNVITGNRVGIAVRPADPSPVVRLTRNRISDNGRDIRRCEAGGTCDPMAARGAMAFGVAGLEHAGFIGSRGGGVTAAATLQHICPDDAPRCQPAPNHGLRAPELSAVAASEKHLHVMGTMAAAPAARMVVELFGNLDSNDSEAGLFLGDAVVYTNQDGRASFSIRVEEPGGSTRVESVTATVTSSDGATSPLSKPRKVVRIAR